MVKLKHIVILTPPLTSILDVAGPVEVFTRTADYIKNNVHSANQNYKTHVISIDGSSIVHTSSGLPIVCEGGLQSIDYEVDTFLIAGRGNVDAAQKQDLIKWVQTHVSELNRLGSICVGAFILAEAGLLDGRRATTHWLSTDQLQKSYPDIRVEKDSIFVKDGKIYTSAGISTGIDLALAMVEEDFGRDIAVMVARLLVLYLKRPGNQSQFSNILMHQHVDYKPIQTILDWIVDNLDQNLTIEILAEKASMSARNFARVFLRETGTTPAKYVEKARLEAARRRLEETQLTIHEISDECGVGSADGLRRLFVRHLQTTPTEYRKNFSTALS